MVRKTYVIQLCKTGLYKDIGFLARDTGYFIVSQPDPEIARQFTNISDARQVASLCKGNSPTVVLLSNAILLARDVKAYNEALNEL